MVQLNYKKYGNGSQTLIIVHGFLGSLDNWHTLASLWGENGLTVYALDMRNHGRSPHTATHTIAEMVDDVYDFMHEHNISQAVLLGHSMGGKVAMQFTLTYPDQVSKLIVADMAPREYKHGHDEVFKAIESVDLKTIKTRKEADEAMQPYLGDFSTRQFVLKNLERNELGGYSWKFNFDTLKRDYEDILKPIYSNHSFSKPVLFLKGELSLYIKERDNEHIHQLFPQAKIASVPDAGHWLHAEQPKLFFEEVLQFVNH
jgi:pimeloyl-ACP methyl ester carboxylesterase